MLSALQSLEQLREGNRRFVTGARNLDSSLDHTRRTALVAEQRPFAVVLGCSDSRVPVEIVFDQGLGDLFVIRVAGNIVASSQIGSIEFAAERFGTRLVVVLGHTGCGAVQATLEACRRPSEAGSRNILSIVERIRPAVEGLLETNSSSDQELLVRRAVRENVRASVDHLRHGSQVLESLIETDGLLIVGAEYALESGIVEFFYGILDSACP